MWRGPDPFHVKSLDPNSQNFHPYISTEPQNPKPTRPEDPTWLLWTTRLNSRALVRRFTIMVYGLGPGSFRI